MKKILIFSCIYLFGCRSSPDVSFDNLTTAYVSWYFKYHPVESTRYNMVDNHGKYMIYEVVEREEYYADISRFLIELSQIDITKITPKARIDYKILYSNLERMKYIMENHRPWEWNPLWSLNEIHDGIYLLSESAGFEMDLRVESVQSRLKELPNFLDQAKTLIIGCSKIHISYANIRIDQLIILLQTLPIKLYSDNLTLDAIDILIKQSIDTLQDYKIWLNTNVEKSEDFNFPLKLNLIESGFQHFVGMKYVPNAVYGLAIKKMISTQDRLFNLTLPIYLEENDEPVWLDRNDTLEVINWTISSITENPNNQVESSQVLSQYYESIMEIEEYVYNKHLILHKKSKSFQLEFAQDYNQSVNPNFLFDHLSRDVDIDIKYYISDFNKDLGEYYLTKQEIDILNAKNVLPGRGVQLAYARSYPSMIRYLFQDPVAVAGWKAYAVKMLIDEGFKNWDVEYHILKLREELSAIVSAIVESNYYSGEISRLNAKDYYIKMAFMDSAKSDIFLMRSDMKYFAGTQSFIGLMELSSLLTEYKRNQEDEFNLSDFHNFILSEGIIPYHELKKQVIYP